MKICPTCGNGYSDELSFCLQDGTGLPARPTSDLTGAPTETYQVATNEDEDISMVDTLVSMPRPVTTPATPPAKQFQMSAVNPSGRTGCVVTVGQISALVLLVFGLGLGGFYLVNQGNSELAYSPVPSSNANKALPDSFNTKSGTGNFASNSTAPVPSATVMGDSNTINAGVLNAKAISLPQPPYPPAARSVRAKGTVEVKVLVDERGRVISANAISGHPLLQETAAQAARGVRFNPTLVAGKAVRVSGVLKYEFVP